MRHALRKMFLTVCLLSVATMAAAAQSLPLAGLAHVAFRVSSVERTRAFYEKLGFEQAFAFDKNGVVTQAFVKINDTQFVELYPAKGDAPAYLHLCFASDDLEALAAQYRKAGLEPSAINKGAAGNILFGLKGPEGQNIEYSQYLPGSLHSNDRGKHLNSKRVADRLIATSVAMRDVPAAEVYYTGKLGFPAPSGPAREMRIPGSSGQFVALKGVGEELPDATFGVADLAKTVRELRRRGLQIMVKGGLATVKDPDGLLLGFRAVK